EEINVQAVAAENLIQHYSAEENKLKEVVNAKKQALRDDKTTPDALKSKIAASQLAYEMAQTLNGWSVLPSSSSSSSSSSLECGFGRLPFPLSSSSQASSFNYTSRKNG